MSNGNVYRLVCCASVMTSPESQRLTALHGYGILDTAPEEMFDRLTALAAEVYSVPIALLSFVDANRQWFKSRVGLAHPETERVVSFCNHTIQSDELLVIPDATHDPRFAQNPLVVHEPGIRFYAGAPLCTSDGYRLGTLCVLDTQPRPTLTPQQQVTLTHLARLVVVQLELRRALERQQQTEHARQTSEARFHALFEAANDAIGISADDQLVHVNPAYARLFGYPSPADMAGLSLYDLIAPATLPTIRERHRRRMAGEPVPDRYITCVRRRDGSEFEAELRLSLLPQDGKAYMLALVRDITAEKEAADTVSRYVEQLARSNADLQQFAYVASHDLQEPLRAITGFAHLLLKRLQNPPDAQAGEFLTHIVEGAKRMQSLIEALLRYARVVGTEAISLAPVPLEAVVQWAQMNLQLLVEETNALITWDELPTVAGDQVQLVQVFQNLLSNAIKYRDPGQPPHVHISAERRESEWVISVRDNGMGIAAEHQSRIFGAFKRLHGAEIPGTGIGLAIAKRIIERHAGRIWAESAGRQGTTFLFTLPVGRLA